MHMDYVKIFAKNEKEIRILYAHYSNLQPIRAHNLLRYSGLFLNKTRKEFRNMDYRIKKLMPMYIALNSKMILIYSM